MLSKVLYALAFAAYLGLAAGGGNGNIFDDAASVADNIAAKLG